QVEAGAVKFRHELARLALENSLSPARQRALHAKVLHALLECGAERVPLARLVHHASLADDGDHVLEFAPAAAQQAAAQGAHREPAAHYRRCLDYANRLNSRNQQETLAGLLDGLAAECSLIGQIEDALQACTAALALWRSLDRKEQVGHDLRQLSRLNWFLG